MPSVHFLPRARTDLNDIWDYIAEHNLDAAERLRERIEEVCQLLAERPQLGRAREELAPGLRSFPAGSYHIFGLSHRPVHREPCPVATLEGVICHEPLCPQGHQDVRLRPRWETAMGGTVRAETSGVLQ